MGWHVPLGLNMSRQIKIRVGESVRSTRRSRIGQGGFALPEVLAAVMLMTVGLTAVTATMLAVFMSSGVNRNHVLSSLEATQVVESLKRAAYVSCATPTSYAAAVTAGPGMSVSITDVKYLSSSVSDSASFQNTCPSPDRGVQRIVVSARQTAGRGGSESIVVFKRNDTCPGSPAPGQRC